MRHIAALSSLASLALVCQVSFANDGPGTKIFDAIQDGQDVRVTVGVLSSDQSLSMVRVGETHTKHLFEQVPIAVDTSPTPTCWYEEEACAPADAEDCYDCDDDGTGDCWSECVEVFYVDYLDECAYPETSDYRVYNGAVGDIGSFESHHWIDIEDTGLECDYDLDGGDESGCSISGVGSRAAPEFGVAVLLAAIGLLALNRRGTPG